MKERLTLSNAVAELGKTAGAEYVPLFEHGSLQIGYYRPSSIDDQRPHAKNEVYVVASGSGYFVEGDKRRPFEVGEVLFVAAGGKHRFEDFSDDFAAWVVFYGPKGGE